MARTTTTTRRPKMTDEERKAYNAEQRARLETVMTTAYAVLHHDPVWNAMLAVAAELAETAERAARGPVNVVAITAQLPNATDVRGKGDWRKEGRYPAKGSTSLRIWAPIGGTRGKDTAEGAETRPEAEAPAADSTTGRKVRTYKAAPVYDISQTDGAPFTATATPGPDIATLAHLLGATDATPTAVADALARHALAGHDGPEMVPGQRAAEAASAAQIAARLLKLPHTPATAPRLAGIVTGEAMTPAIKESAVRVIEYGRALAQFATGRA